MPTSKLTLMPSLIFSCLGGVLMGVSFAQPQLGALSFIAFVPVLQLAFRSCFMRSYLYALIVGITIAAVANYWVYFFLENLLGVSLKTALLFACYIIYSAHSICLFVLGARWFVHRLPLRVSLAVIPLFACTVFHYWPSVFPFNPALTQINATDMLQPAALFSHWSLCAFIIFINLLLATHCSQRSQAARLFSQPVVTIGLAFSLWLALGAVSRWSFSADHSRQTPLTIGFHQPQDPVGSELPSVKTGFIRSYTGELANSYRLAQAGASLIVWPESRRKDILNKPWVLAAYKNHAKNMTADLMLQEITPIQRRPPQYRNASIFIAAAQTHRVHHKMKRIPFGEKIPEFLDRGELGPWLHKVFAGVLKPIQAGEKPEIFTHKGIKILPQICYEFLDDQLVNTTLRQHPEVQLIIAQSNDNWFFSRTQVILHNAVAVLRAVENRRPLLHVVNAGPSFVIDAYGEIRQLSLYQASGGFIADLQVSTQSPSHHMLIAPKTFIQLAAGATLLAFLGGLLASARNTKSRRNKVHPLAKR